MTALLREGLRELGLDESRAETLERFAALLLKKNEVMNLTAITEPEAVAQLTRPHQDEQRSDLYQGRDR